jgi:hypothetical protein
MKYLIFVTYNYISLASTADIFKHFNPTPESFNNYNIFSNISKAVFLNVFRPRFGLDQLQRRLEFGGCNTLQIELLRVQD